MKPYALLAIYSLSSKVELLYQNKPAIRNSSSASNLETAVREECHAYAGETA